MAARTPNRTSDLDQLLFSFSRLTIRADNNIFVGRILTNDLLFDVIFDASSPANILRLSRTCQTANAAVKSYISRVFNVNRLLSRYFSNPLEFRSLQAQTAALVSGSTALQFFNREIYPDSDLDIYVSRAGGEEMARWVIAQGYQFQPYDHQDADFEIAILKEKLEDRDEQEDEDEEEEDEEGAQFMDYSLRILRGISSVFTFVKPSEKEQGSELKVQVIVSIRAPMEVILRFHSSLVLNIIAWDRAYSLYPRATFEERCSLFLRSDLPRNAVWVTKYIARGWHMLYTSQDSYTFLGILNASWTFRWIRPRWISDRWSWTLCLPVEGVTAPSPVNSRSSALTSDPSACTGWCLQLQAANLPRVVFHVVEDRHLYHTYVAYGSWTLRATERLKQTYKQEARTHKNGAQSALKAVKYLDEELIQHFVSRMKCF